MITSGKSDVKWSRLVFVATFFCLVPAVWCLFGSFWIPSKHQSESSSISVRAGVIVLELKRSQIFKGRWWRPNVWPLEKTSLSVPTDVNLKLQQEKLVALYPDLLSNETIPCDCGSMQCDSVYWFRTIPAAGQVQYLGKLNNANIFSPGTGVNTARFEFKRKTKTSFSLKINSVTEEDTGVYSCVLKDRKAKEVWKSGVLLLPGGL